MECIASSKPQTSLEIEKNPNIQNHNVFNMRRSDLTEAKLCLATIAPTEFQETNRKSIPDF